ncbi:MULTISPECIES: hypothetical protein [unclassified Streptomyces]|uniref:hypothetical protein n=1 Tax=unclassified Streptomyces TaxID=2593676 RepID=UPI001BE98DC2|nr:MULTISPECIES: hypothetical protein [unclassified Streptomyces]MBT2406331.1 hypothetical protein [Streptomyces sp. ISL-21]MBT2607377.1 hypothetical protein [Streptomyces sp. ISL-87]
MGDVGEVGEVAGDGERAQPADGGGQGLVLAADGVVEGEGELHEPVEEGKPGGLDVALQAQGAVDDAAGSGVLDQGDDLGEETVGALVETVEELVGERELVASADRVSEREGQREADLRHRALAGGTVLFRLRARGLEGGDGAGGVGLGPVDVAEDAVVAAFPAQGGDGGQGGGEIAGEASQVGQAAAGPGGEPAVGVGDLLHPRAGGVVQAEVLVGLGPVVQDLLG